MLNHVRKHIFKYSEELKLKKNRLKIQLAYSGGLDSSCLLDILMKLKDELNIDIFLSYVNYQTSNYSYDVLNYIEDFSKNINKNIKNVKISNEKNFESEARIIRYKFFKEIADRYNIPITFTAHHKLDQLETLIMQFINNSDFISMVGIRKDFEGIKRPILDCSKNSIFKYAQDNNVKFFKDPSNSDYRFKRNKVRKLITPFLLEDAFLLMKIKHVNNQAVQKLIRLKKDVKTKINTIVSNSDNKKIYLVIPYDFISMYSYIELKFFIQVILKRQFGENDLFFSKSFWVQLKSFLESSNTGRIFKLSNSYSILKDRNSIIIYDNKRLENMDNKKIKIVDRQEWGFGEMFIDKTKFNKKSKKYQYSVDYSTYKKGIYVRAWKYGDRVTLQDGRHKKVSDIFIDRKVPLFKKKSYPIVENSKRDIIWIPGLFQKKRILKTDIISLNWRE